MRTSSMPPPMPWCTSSATAKHTSPGARSVEAGRTHPLYRDLLADATFHQLLLACDADLADGRIAKARAEPLPTPALHSACYPRKPRGRPCRLGPEHDRRF